MQKFATVLIATLFLLVVSGCNQRTAAPSSSSEASASSQPEVIPASGSEVPRPHSEEDLSADYIKY